MKKTLAYLLLFSFLIFSLSACSSSSDPAPAPQPPDISTLQFRADAGDTAVTLDWTMLAGATTYNIYFSASPALTKNFYDKKITGLIGPRYTVATLAGNLTPLSNGTTYYFCLSAVIGGVESALSLPISAIPIASPSTPLAAPTNVRADVGDETATITWDAVADADSYNIYYEEFGSSPGSLSDPFSSATTSYTQAPLDNWLGDNLHLVYYYFWVTTVKGITESAPSFAVSVIPRPSATPYPAAPTLSSATPGNGTVTLVWTAVTGATAYNIYYSTAYGVTKATGAMSSVDSSTTTATAYLDNTYTYYFVVTAVTANGESMESNQLSATPPGP